MKKGFLVFLTLAFFSFVNIFIELFLVQFIGAVGFILAFVAFLQMIAWIMIAQMWHEVMET